MFVELLFDNQLFVAMSMDHKRGKARARWRSLANWISAKNIERSCFEINWACSKCRSCNHCYTDNGTRVSTLLGNHQLSRCCNVQPIPAPYWLSTVVRRLIRHNDIHGLPNHLVPQANLLHLFYTKPYAQELKKLLAKRIRQVFIILRFYHAFMDEIYAPGGAGFIRASEEFMSSKRKKLT